MPTRIIRDGFLGSDKLASLRYKPNAENLYLRLILAADDYGMYYASPARVARGCWPMRDDVTGKMIEPLLRQLAEVQLIVLYEAEGDPYLQITNSQQRSMGKPRFPLPCGYIWDDNRKEIVLKDESSESLGEPPRTTESHGEMLLACTRDVRRKTIDDKTLDVGTTRAGATAPAVDVSPEVVSWNGPGDGHGEDEPAEDGAVTVSELIKQYTANKDLQNDLKSFVVMRKGMRRPVTPRAMKGLLKKLDELAQTDESRRAHVREAEMKAWLSFYPIGGSVPGIGTARVAPETKFSLERKDDYYANIKPDFDGLDGDGIGQG